MDNFKCRAESLNYCNQWLRSCVSWQNCNIANYGAPCPYCETSSPLESESCKTCVHYDWKKAHYQE